MSRHNEDLVNVPELEAIGERRRAPEHHVRRGREARHTLLRDLAHVSAVVNQLPFRNSGRPPAVCGVRSPEAA